MEQALTLIASESFGELPCSFYQQEGADDILLTREQIGLALEYADPAVSIGTIHRRHKDRLDRFSVLIKLINTDDGKEYDTYFYNEKTSSYSNYYLRLQARSGYDQRWEQRAIRQVKAVAEFIGTEDTQLLRRIYQEMESRYGIVLDDFVKDYKRVKRITRCSTLSVVSFSFPLREMFDAIVGELCAVCGIENDNGQQLGLVESIAEALAFREVEA